MAFDCWCSLASSPEKEELKSVPLETGENNLAKALGGEELEATHLNEVWDYSWINMDGALKKKITQNVHIISGVLECTFFGVKKVVRNGVQRPLLTITFKKTSWRRWIWGGF